MLEGQIQNANFKILNEVCVLKSFEIFRTFEIRITYIEIEVPSGSQHFRDILLACMRCMPGSYIMHLVHSFPWKSSFPLLPAAV